MWHKFTFDMEQLNRGAGQALLDAYESLKNAGTLPRDTILFAYNEDMTTFSRSFMLSNGELTCTDLIATFKGKPSQPPTKVDRLRLSHSNGESLSDALILVRLS